MDPAKKEAHNLGYGSGGIQKGSNAASDMSTAAKSGGGGVTKGGPVSSGQHTGAK